MNIVADALAVRNYNPHTSWRKTLLLHRCALVPLWDIYFPAHDLATGRLKRFPLDTFERSCVLAEAEAAKRPLDPKVRRVRRLLDDPYAWQEFYDPRHRATSQVTIEAIWEAIRRRGIAALHEPETKARLSVCDDAARAELQRRLERLRASG
jgi:hypothetical protein